MKKLLIIVITFLTVFMPQSKVWAETKYSTPVQEVISVDKSAFFGNESPDILAYRFKAVDGFSASALSMPGPEMLLAIPLIYGTYVLYGLIISLGILIYNSITEKKSKTGAWFASVFIPGLGQMIMGNGWKGVLFLFLEILVSLIFPFVLAFFPTVPGGFFFNGGLAVFQVFRETLFITIHIWNMIDAYNLSRDISETKEKESLIQEELLYKTIEFTKNIKISRNCYVSVRAFSF